MALYQIAPKPEMKVLDNFTLNIKIIQDIETGRIAHHNLSQEKDRHWGLTEEDATPKGEPLLHTNTKCQVLKSWEACTSCMQKN